MCENIRKCKAFLEQCSIKPNSLPSIHSNINSVIFQKDKHPRLSFNALDFFFPQYRWLWGAGSTSLNHKKNAGWQTGGLSHRPRLMWVGSVFPRVRTMSFVIQKKCGRHCQGSSLSTEWRGGGRMGHEWGRGDGAVHIHMEKVVKETHFLLGLSLQTGLWSIVWRRKQASEQTLSHSVEGISITLQYP